MATNNDSDNMYVSMSIASYGPPTLPREEKKTFATKQSNATEDIDGARPRTTKVWTKPDLWDTRDVSGSQSKALHHQRSNAPDNSLRVDDIDGAQAKIRDKMLLTKRHTNPMEPQYRLPQAAEAPPYQPKFLRDSQDISDIDRACPMVPVKYATRDPISVQDIVGAQANWRPRHERARLDADPHPIMEIGDVTRRTHRYVDRTTRIAQVLDPVYNLHGEVIMDDPKYTKPRPLKKEIHDSHLLQTRDIAGAYSGWTNAGRDRREWKNTNFTGDIDGAQADTIKHSIVTTRCTHPLSKIYTSLDGEQLVGPVSTLVPAHIVKQPTLRNSTNIGNKTAAEQLQDTAGDCLSSPASKQAMKSHDSKPETDSNNHGGFNFSSGPNSARKSARGAAALTSMDSAAYSTKAAPEKYDSAKENLSSGSMSARNGGGGAGATPRSARVRRQPEQPHPDPASEPMMSFADKFVKTEQLILPTREAAAAAMAGGKPPRPSDNAGGRPPMVPPPLDFSKVNTAAAAAAAPKGSGGSHSCRSNPSGSSARSGRGGSSSARSAPKESLSQRREAMELKDAIDSVRALG